MNYTGKTALHYYYEETSNSLHVISQSTIELPIIQAGYNVNITNGDQNVAIVNSLNCFKNVSTYVSRVLDTWLKVVLTSLPVNLQHGLQPCIVRKTSCELIAQYTGYIISKDWLCLRYLYDYIQLVNWFGRSFDFDNSSEFECNYVPQNSNDRESSPHEHDSIAEETRMIFLNFHGMLPLKRLASNIILQCLQPNAVCGITKLNIIPDIIKSYIICQHEMDHMIYSPMGRNSFGVI